MDENPTLQAATPTPSLDEQGDANAATDRIGETDQRVSAASKAGKTFFSPGPSCSQPSCEQKRTHFAFRSSPMAPRGSVHSTASRFWDRAAMVASRKTSSTASLATPMTCTPATWLAVSTTPCWRSSNYKAFPIETTVSFTWRELARLMGKEWKGQNKAKYQAAIRSIHGLRIISSLALKQKTSYCDVAT